MLDYDMGIREHTRPPVQSCKPVTQSSVRQTWDKDAQHELTSAICLIKNGGSSAQASVACLTYVTRLSVHTSSDCTMAPHTFTAATDCEAARAVS